MNEITGDNVTTFTYSGFVNLKAKPGADILAVLDPVKCHLLHMAIGVSGEAAEAFEAQTKDHLIEECGDIEFFLQGMSINGTGIGCVEYCESPRRNIEYRTAPYAQENLITAAGNLLDQIKKWIIYNKPAEMYAINTYWYGVHHALDDIYRILGVTRLDVLKANVDKLNKRYAKNYSDTEAQVRADKIGDEA